VTQVQPIAVIFTLPEDALPAIRAALESGPVPVTTLSRDGAGELDHGELALIDNQIAQTTGTIRLKAIFSNLHNTLWPGQYVTARVLVRIARNALTLPSSAVQLGPHGPFTYVVKADSTVEARPLTIAEQTGTLTTVSAGLKQNERVVTTNQYRLQPGTLVQAAPDAPAPAPAARGAT
jgi:multidrug efflux system membrane fusion protein